MVNLLKGVRVINVYMRPGMATKRYFPGHMQYHFALIQFIDTKSALYDNSFKSSPSSTGEGIFM